MDGEDYLFADQYKLESMILNQQLLEFERHPKTNAITGSSVQAAKTVKLDGGLIGLLCVDKVSHERSVLCCGSAVLCACCGPAVPCLAVLWPCCAMGLL